MLTGRLKYILGISLLIIILVLVVGGKFFWEKTKLEKSPFSPPSEIIGIIKTLGSEDEFTIEKDGEIVFQNKAGDEPKIKYRMSYPGRVVPARWSDLELKDRVSLETYYDTAGQIEYQILRIFREE